MTFAVPDRGEGRAQFQQWADEPKRPVDGEQIRAALVSSGAIRPAPGGVRLPAIRIPPDVPVLRIDEWGKRIARQRAKVAEWDLPQRDELSRFTNGRRDSKAKGRV